MNNSKQINCKNCNNPFGYLKKNVIQINYKRVYNIECNFETKKASVKCRTCSHYSSIGFEKDLLNELDYKKTSTELLK